MKNAFKFFSAAIYAFPKGTASLGLVNLVSKKGTKRHKSIGTLWLIMMLFVTVPSFWIREINDGDFSWIHLLTIWTLISMVIMIVSIKKGYIKTHVYFVTGIIAGLIISSGFAMLPGRYISHVLGYG